MVEEQARPFVRYAVVPVTTYEVRRSFIDPTVNLPASMVRAAEAGEPKGSYDSPDTAHAVAYALCAEEHRKSGEPLDSPAFVYPEAVRDEAKAIMDGTRVAIQRMVAEGVRAGMAKVRAGG